MPTPYFWTNFLFRVKVYWISTHPGADVEWAWHDKWSVLMEVRSTATSAMHIWGMKLGVILQQKFLQSSFADVANATCKASYTVLIATWCHSESCMLLVALLYTTDYLLRGIEQMWNGHSFMVKCGITRKSGHDLFVGLARCYATGWSFVRLQYSALTARHSIHRSCMCDIDSHTCTRVILGSTWQFTLGCARNILNVTML